MTQVAIVYFSGYGHTEKLARAVESGAQSVAGTDVLVIKADAAAADLGVLDRADAIIFGAPTYMGSLAAPFKSFMDATSHLWMQRKWVNKLAAGFTNSASQSGDKLASLYQLVTFAMQHGMVWVGTDLMPGNNSSKGSPADMNRLGSYIGSMAQSNADEGPDTAPPESDLKTAAYLGQRVAEWAKRIKP